VVAAGPQVEQLQLAVDAVDLSAGSLAAAVAVAGGDGGPGAAAAVVAAVAADARALRYETLRERRRALTGRGAAVGALCRALEAGALAARRGEAAEALKAKGNARFRARDYRGAADEYSRALECDPSNKVAPAGQGLDFLRSRGFCFVMPERIKQVAATRL